MDEKWTSDIGRTACPRDCGGSNTSSSVNNPWFPDIVIAGLEPAIHTLSRCLNARFKPGHDAWWK